MANWEKLNKEFDDALDSMTSEDWELLASKRIKKKTRTMKTAVEWLMEELPKHGSGAVRTFGDLFEQAKEMEKEIAEKEFFKGTFKQQEQ